MQTLQKIEEMMNTPSLSLIEDIKRLEGDVIILGVSGKIGYNLSTLLTKALKKSGKTNKVIGVARFSDGLETRSKFEAIGVETIVCDFMDDASLKSLPKVDNVIFMAGYKFGTSGNEDYTWAINSYLPGKVAEHFDKSKIVVFSTGCVYPLVDVSSAAPSEEDPLGAIGEYAQSCLGRERIFEYFAKKNNTPMLIFRLNYAIDVRYGVLLELAQSIYHGYPVDLTMGQVNVVWQPDVSEAAIRSLFHTQVPANILNYTGPETLSVRWICERMAEHMGKEVTFVSEEAPTALLNNASKAHELFGYPRTTIREMIQHVCDWVMLGGDVDDKPTHFQERDGNY